MTQTIIDNIEPIFKILAQILFLILTLNFLLANGIVKDSKPGISTTTSIRTNNLAILQLAFPNLSDYNYILTSIILVILGFATNTFINTYNLYLKLTDNADIQYYFTTFMLSSILILIGITGMIQNTSVSILVRNHKDKNHKKVNRAHLYTKLVHGTKAMYWSIGIMVMGGLLMWVGG